MELTEIEKDYKLLMRNIVQSLADTPYVLKGGTALILSGSNSPILGSNV
jgi:hypothetical protein